MAIVKRSHYPLYTLLLIAAITALRAHAQWFNDFSLYIDESQYWLWAQNLQWGYYSKPPGIAALIALTTAFFGDAEWAVRLGTLLVYPLTGWLLYLLTKRLFDSRTAWFAVLLFMLSPAVGMSGLLISTDVLLFLFWTAAMLLFHRALESNRWFDWLLLGVVGGLGMLSKYNFGVFVIAAVLFMLLANYWRVLFNYRLWVAGAVAALIWLPNLIWNAEHQYITFVHTTEIVRADANVIDLLKSAEFFFGQLAVFGPVAFVFWLRMSWQYRGAHWQYLMLFAWVFLLIVLYQSSKGHTQINWAAPTYIAASILVARGLVIYSRRIWLILIIVTQVAMLMLIYYQTPLFKTLGVPLTQSNDLAGRVRGWDALGQQFKQLHKQYPEAVLITGQERAIAAQLHYYARPLTSVAWTRTKKIRHHYDMRTPLAETTATEFLYVNKKGLPKALAMQFEGQKRLPDLDVKTLSGRHLNYQVFYLQHLKKAYSTLPDSVPKVKLRMPSSKQGLNEAPKQ